MSKAVLFPPRSQSEEMYYATSKHFIPKQKDFPALEIDGELLGNGNSSAVVMDLEEKRRLRRERQKVKKEAKKQEKAAKREEEVLKQRLAPKDQKLKIIDQSILERLQAKETSTCYSSTQWNVCHSSEFPSLGEIMSSSNRFQSNRSQKRNDSKVGDFKDSKAVLEKKEPEAGAVSVLDDKKSSGSALEVGKTSICGSATHSPREQGTLSEPKDSNGRNCQEDGPISLKVSGEKSSGKRPKRRDPIQLDIHEILKVQETKGETHVKPKVFVKQEVVRYSGNILDSDNPERKRGKQREVPKPKKPSNLKQAILQDRVKRKEASLQQCQSQSEDQCVASAPGSPLGDSSDGAHSEKHTPQPLEKELMVEVVVLDGEPEIGSGSGVREERTLVLQEVSSGKNGREKQVECSLEVKNSGETKNHAGVALPPKIHSRKFRDYCDHCLLPEILTSTAALLEDIVKFHDRQYARSPLKATAKRRHVTGMKEVRRFLALRRIRLLVIAPDLEPSGELDQIVAQLKESASVNGVPYVFALGRRQLGYTLKKKVPVSCVGVLNYDGTENNFRNLMSAVEKARELYKERVAVLSPELRVPGPVEENAVEENAAQGEDVPQAEDVNKTVVATLLGKLTEAGKESPPPLEFLEAIERCVESFSDEDLQPEE